MVEWRRGLLVLHSTDFFAQQILPRYFNTRNFKTFRRQLNYYGFVHVRSFTTTGAATTALWVNRDLARNGSDDISSVLKLKRVEPSDAAKTAEGRRERKEQAIYTVEEDLGVNARSLQMDQIRSLALRGEMEANVSPNAPLSSWASDADCVQSREEPMGRVVSRGNSIAAEDENVSAASLLLMLAKSGNP